METSQDKSKRIAKNTLFLFFRMALILFVGLFTSRVVLSTLGVEDYGIYNLVGSVVVLFSFLQTALNNATYRFFAYELGRGNGDQLKKTFAMALNAHVILAVIVFVLCEIAGIWFLNHKLVVPEGRMGAANIAFHLSMACFCLNIIKTPYNSAIIVHERMGFFAYTSIIEVLMKLGIVYMLVYFAMDKLVLYSILTLGIAVILLVWYVVHCIRQFEECRYRFVWDGGLIKGMLKYSGWSIIVNGVDVSVNQSILFFFNVFFGVVANAAMGIANQVSGHLTSFLSSFTQSYNPQIIKSYAAGDRNYFIKLIFSTSKISYYLLLMASMPILLNIDLVLRVWLKNPPEGTSTFVILVVAYALIDAYSAPLWIGVHATGNLRTHQILMSCIKVLNIPLAYVMLKMGCPAWTALALKAGLNVVCSIARPCYVRKLYGLPLGKYMLQVWGVVYLVTALVLPLPMFIACKVESPWVRLIASSLAFFVILVPVVYLIGLSQEERALMQSMLKKKLGFLFAHKKG